MGSVHHGTPLLEDDHMKWFLAGLLVGAVMMAAFTGADLPRIVYDGIQQVTNAIKPKPARPEMEWRFKL